MKLDNLYSLRRDFTVIGLTGRTGSGCTTIAEYLEGTYTDLKDKGIRDLSKSKNIDPIFKKKFDIVNQFVGYPGNWQKFDIIKYKDVLLFYIIHKYGGNSVGMENLLGKYYRISESDRNETAVKKILLKLKNLDNEYKKLISDIKSFDNFENIREENELRKLNDSFFGPHFKAFSKELFDELEKNGYYRRTMLLHRVACNIRKSGDPLSNVESEIKNIYSIAKVINRLVKARKFDNRGKNYSTRIVIDSLRNSLEIMFFKERYSAFYMVATKDVLERSEDRIKARLPSSIKGKERDLLVRQLLELDNEEYKSSDFSKGKFSSPDVENCIQKSDYHIFNLKMGQVEEFIKKHKINNHGNGFLTREEQLLKLIALINQPGLISPSSVERSMQIAHTAKLNSGCISRNVGAVITDSSYYVMSVGWNDVAKGHTPCNLRDVRDFENESALKENVHYSDFEKGKFSSIASFKYKNSFPENFKDGLKNYYEKGLEKNGEDLHGKNCAFCFKTVHNHFEGEGNQVHTRSLHAEENAMLQITKIGGGGVKNGILFTTASPCELCSKKAYQIGIRSIFYIDPYPGISEDQILKGGDKKRRPNMIPFSGGIGNAYHKLYDSFLSYKDEISMTLELGGTKKETFLKSLIRKMALSDDSVKEYFEKNPNLTEQELEKLIAKGISSKI